MGAVFYHIRSFKSGKPGPVFNYVLLLLIPWTRSLSHQPSCLRNEHGKKYHLIPLLNNILRPPSTTVDTMTNPGSGAAWPYQGGSLHHCLNKRLPNGHPVHSAITDTCICPLLQRLWAESAAHFFSEGKSGLHIGIRLVLPGHNQCLLEHRDIALPRLPTICSALWAMIIILFIHLFPPYHSIPTKCLCIRAARCRSRGAEGPALPRRASVCQRKQKH